MEYPKRKRLRLQDYDYSQDGYYFLTICTRGKEELLSRITLKEDGSAKVVLSHYGTVAESYLQSIPGIDKYVIMPNHIHMIIHKTNGKSIVSDMRSYKALVTKQIGESIWQDSYYDHIIRNEEDYREKWRYIDQNPAKWADDEYNAQGGMP